MTVEEITAKIEVVWKLSRAKKMDWLGMENCIRDILRAKKEGTINPDEALNLIDKSVAAYTLRGHSL